MTEKPLVEYEAGGWTTRRGEREGILVYASVPHQREKKVAVWFDKMTATRLAHTVLEAQIRFWDILWMPQYVKESLRDTAYSVGMDVSEPYREGCPFCPHVADSREEMREHLKEHEVHIVIAEEEAEP